MRSILLSVPLVFVMGVVLNAQSPSWLGVSIDDGSDSGVRVDEVEADSPAAQAGLEAGDLILEFDGMRVVGVRQFTRVVRETPAGRTVTVRILRGEEERTLQLTTEAQPSFRDLRVAIPENFPDLRDLSERVRRSIPDIRMSMSVARAGVQVDGMTSELREFFGVDPDTGILVVSVDPDSPAETAGLLVGDVIISIDGEEIDSPSDFSRPGFRNRDSVALTVMRDRSEVELTLDPVDSDN